MHQTAASAIAELTTILAAPPSDGLQQMVTDLMATGLPLGFERLSGSPVGSAAVRADGIVLSLADVSDMGEGVVSHELAHALLETKGWPCLFAGEDEQHWVGRIQKTLATLLDHASGIALQRHYGADYARYEQFLLDKQLASVKLLHAKSPILNTMDMSAEQEIEYGVGLALMALERFLRQGGTVEADFFNALELFPGAQALFVSLNEFMPKVGPGDGWSARRIMGAIVERLDDYMEIKGEVRPLVLLSHFVPAVHPDDATKPLGEVADVFLQPLVNTAAGEHAVFVLPHRDHLPFGFRQTFADESAKDNFAARMVTAGYGDFCRAIVPEAFLFWQPTSPEAVTV